MASAWQNLNAQCDCPDYVGLVASLTSAEILPFCDEIGINTVIENLNGYGCAADVILRISFGVTGGTGPTESLNYLGNLPLAFEDTWSSGPLDYRRFNFLISGIADFQAVNNLLRFSLTPNTSDAASFYRVVVDLIPRDPECGADPGLNTYSSSFDVKFELTETVISGAVTDLIDSQDLLPNSATNPLVERKTIHGVLEVNEDYSFDGAGGSDLARPKLYLGPGSQILVKSGFAFTLTNADIFTCDELAQGIVVESGATLIMDGCVISDSRFGIDAQAGSTISVTDNDFVDNYIGARFHMAAAPNRVTINAFSGNDFFTDDGVKTPFSGMPEAVEARGYCGIWLNNYQDFNVFGGNDFASLANGIVGNNSIGNLGNMTFSDMNSVGTSVYPREGFGIWLASQGTHWFNINEFWTSMTFDDCKTGIFASNYALNVENTTMTDVGVGIDCILSTTKDIVLDDNTITAKYAGIRSFMCEPVHPVSDIRNNTITVTEALTALNDFTTGIKLDEIGFAKFTQTNGKSGWEVNSNDITLEQGGRGILYRNGGVGAIRTNSVINESQPDDYIGIYTEGTQFSDFTANTIDQITSAGLGTSQAIYSNGGFANTFQCNCLDNTNIGAQFSDMAEFTDAVRGNNFNTHCTGLLLNDGAFIGGQNHTGNLWDLSAITGNCLGRRNYGNPDESPFYVNGSSNSALNPTVFPLTGWFISEPGTTFSCCATCSFPPQIPPRVTEGSVPTSLDNAIATETLSYNVFEDEMTWKGKYRLYRKILRQPAIESYAAGYADFMDDNENLSVGKLAYIAGEKARLFALSATEDSTLESRRILWQHKMNGLRELDSLLQAGATVNQVQYDTAVGQSASAQAQYEQYAANLKTARKAKIQALLPLNAAVTTSLTPDANHKSVNGIVLNYLLSDTLASGHLATLESIAEQCPLEGGDAVYEARAMMSHFTGHSFDDTEICASTERQQRPGGANRAIKNEAVAIYPSPTTGQLSWSSTGDLPVVLRIFNATGQLQMEQTISGASAQIGQLPEGLYQVQLLNAQDRTLLISQKVLLVKH